MTYTATSWSQVQTACNSASSAGDIVFLDFASSSATSSVTWTAPANAMLIGRGSSDTGGGDLTIVTDDFNSSSGLLGITISATGTFRMTGITWRTNDNDPVKEGGEIVFTGPGAIRVDHCHFDNHTNQGVSGDNNSKVLWIGDGIFGVIDNCIMDFNRVTSIYVANGAGASGVGNETWAAATDFGSFNFVFFEDNLFRATTTSPVRIMDIFSGGRAVARFNTIQGGAGLEVHATRTGDGRGARAAESYGNSFTVLPGQAYPPRTAADVSSGTMLLWGNLVAAEALQSIFTFNITRISSLAYTPGPPPGNWGYNGPSPIRTGTGTVNVTGTAVTWVSGPTFDTGWPAGTMIYIVGMSASVSGGQTSAAGGIASVNSTTSITLQNGGHTGAPITGAAYYVGSAWDGNTDALGYPAIDQPGRGQGDLLAGSFPNKLISGGPRDGTAVWPQQALEPVYFWKNEGLTTGIAPGYNGNNYTDYTAGRVVANRDYYPQASGIQTSPTSPFDGTVGAGWGTLANRPTTCTAGVAYFAIDEGNWNKSSFNPYGAQQNGSNGVLYKATATNTWTLYYTPYEYPHPLRNEIIKFKTFGVYKFRNIQKVKV